MADATAASSGAPVLARARLKPDIYKTVDGKVIVEDELLHFLAIKIRTLSQDEIIMLAANNFDSDWIEASKKMLFELCPTTQRNISHKGAQKDANNIKSCLKVLNECGDNVPRFVSHYLDELPPVTFTNMDVCGLFRKIEQLHNEVSAMKHALHQQNETSEGLRVVTADMNRRVSALEQHFDHGSASFIAPVRQLDAGNASAAHATNSAVVGDSDGSAEGTETPDDRHRGEAQGPLPVTVESATPALGPGLTMSSPGSSMWSRVVKKGKQQRTEDYQQGSSTGKSVVGRKKAGKTIVGTGDAGAIKMITTKRVVFATPGMLHAGQSLQIFKKWAGNEKNMVIMPGYCVQGTIGHKILNGQRKLELEGRSTLEVKLQVEYMSFSAHADAKGIMQLIRMAEPRNMLLVHGEAVKMEFLKGKIEQEFSIDCYMPANGETTTVTTNPNVPVDISLNLLKREMALGGTLPDPKKPRTMHGTLIMKENSLRLVSPEQAMKELGLSEHHLRFTCRVQLQDPHNDAETLHRIYMHLKSVLKGYTTQHLPDSMSVMVESIVVKVSSSTEDPNTKVLLLSWSYQDEDLGSFLSTLLKKGLPSALC